jgi:Domain of unknown function (DUF4062)/NACHT domain/HEAT repeats
MTMGSERLVRRAYISATYNDLRECRQRAALVLKRMGYLDVAMEYYVAENRRSLDRCLEDVAGCDLYVGIFAWRYGWVPPHEDGRKLSITEREYRRAVELDKPRLLFLLDESAPWPPAMVDASRTRIRKLRGDLAADRQPALFSSPDTLDVALAAALSHLVLQRVTASPAAARPGRSRAAIDWEGYRAAMVRLHRYLDLEALVEPQRDDLLRLQLRSVFVEPSVRTSTPPLELPEATWERLVERGEVHSEDLPPGVSAADVRADTAAREEPARPVLAALAEPGRPHAILLGDPGAGKSTVARFLVLSLLEPDGAAALRQVLAGYLPLLIELKTYAALCTQGLCRSFVEFVDLMGRTEGWRLGGEALQHFLSEDGRVMLIVDGLDEIVDSAERERAARQIAGFASDHRRARVLVTSRAIGYRRKVLTDAGFAHLTLQDLGEDQVTEFTERWYSLALADRPADARQRTERILAAFRQSASIRQLAGNPMLLTIMVIIGRHQELPRERWKLYEHAASVLIQHWDVNKHLHDRNVAAAFIGEDDKKELLRRLAYRMQAGGEGFAGNYVPGDLLQREFEAYLGERYAQPPDRAAAAARVLIEELRARNFILALHGANLYGFVHRAFLEYFCAVALVHRFEKTHELSLEELKHEIYGAHWDDPAWQEVLRLVCGMLDARWAGELIAFLTMDANPYWTADPDAHPPEHLVLATQCLAEVRSRRAIEPACATLLRAIVSALEGPEWISKRLSLLVGEKLTSAVEEVGSDWPGSEWLRESLASAINYVPRALRRASLRVAVSILGRDDRLRHTLEGLTGSHSEYTRGAALEALALAWPHEPRVCKLVEERARRDEDFSVRTRAIRLLSDTLARSPGVRGFIERLAAKDASSRVRAEALDALAGGWPNEVRVRRLVERWALQDDDSEVATSALTVLARTWPLQPGVRELVERRAVKAHHGERRAVKAHHGERRAVRAHHGERWARRAHHDHVREAALWALARTWPQEVGAREAVERALQDDDSSVREGALDLMAEVWPGTAGLRERFEQRALHDKGLGSYRTLQRLATTWPGEGSVRELLELRAKQDDEVLVRRVALSALARIWPQEEGVRYLVEKRSVEDADGGVRGRALKLLAECWPEEEGVRQLLERRVIEDPTGSVRGASLAALARTWPQEEGVRELVERRAVEDAEGVVRGSALAALARRWPQDESVRRLVERRTVEDTAWSARAAALAPLARSWSQEEGVRELVERRIVEDTARSVRAEALEVLAHSWPRVEGVRELIERRAVVDGESSVRWRALRVLADRWPQQAGARSCVEQSALQDADRDVRSEALRVLAATWPRVASVRQVLRRALEDGESDVRRSALEGLLGIEADPTVRLIFSRHLDGLKPFLDPSSPIPPEHLRKAAARLGIRIGQARGKVAECSRRLGWDLRKGQPASPPARATGRQRGGRASRKGGG